MKADTSIASLIERIHVPVDFRFFEWNSEWIQAFLHCDIDSILLWEICNNNVRAHLLYGSQYAKPLFHSVLKVFSIRYSNHDWCGKGVRLTYTTTRSMLNIRNEVTFITVVVDCQLSYRVDIYWVLLFIFYWILQYTPFSVDWTNVHLIVTFGATIKYLFLRYKHRKTLSTPCYYHANNNVYSVAWRLSSW